MSVAIFNNNKKSAISLSTKEKFLCNSVISVVLLTLFGQYTSGYFYTVSGQVLSSLFSNLVLTVFVCVCVRIVLLFPITSKFSIIAYQLNLQMVPLCHKDTWVCGIGFP